MDKCPICWSHGTPRQWASRSAPAMPNSKAALQEALQGLCSGIEDMTKPELRHLFRKHIRGERSPGDPSYGLSSLSHGDLQKRMQDHNLSILPRMTKDAMIFSIRSHWSKQCALAQLSGQRVASEAATVSSQTTMQPYDEDDGNDSWSEQGGSSTLLRDIFSKLHLLGHDDVHEGSLKAFLNACSKHSHLSGLAADVEQAYKSFLAGKAALLEKLISCDDAEFEEVLWEPRSKFYSDMTKRISNLILMTHDRWYDNNYYYIQLQSYSIQSINTYQLSLIDQAISIQILLAPLNIFEIQERRHKQSHCAVKQD